MNEKIRVGIWGLGRAGGTMHVNEVNANAEQFEIVAGCDLEAVRREAFAVRTGAKVYADPAALLADKNIELLVVATRSIDHVRHARQALDAGFSVLLEKPLALSRTEAEQLVELDKKYPGKLFCRQNRRFETMFQHIREIIASGILGSIHTIKLRRNAFSRRDDWQTLRKNGGGQLNNWGPHLIDQALQFLDYEVESVWSELKLTANQGDAEDSIKILIKGKHGCTVDIEVYDGNALSNNFYEVYGSRGALHGIFRSDAEQDLQLRYIDPAYELKKFPVNEGLTNGFVFADNAKLPWIRTTIMVDPKLKVDMNSLYAYLYKTMRKGEPFPITLQQALAVLEICDTVRAQNPQFK